MDYTLTTLYKRFDTQAEALSEIDPLNSWGKPAKTEADWARISDLRASKAATVRQIQNFLKND